MKLTDLVLLGLFGAAAVAAKAAHKSGRAPAAKLSPADALRAEMAKPDPVRPFTPRPADPLYGVVRQSAPHLAPYSLN